MNPNNSSIKHHQLESFLKSVKENDPPGLYLIHGESYLLTQALDRLVSFLLGASKKQFALETLEGGSVSMGDIIEQATTFSFLVSRKIVAVKNAPLFHKEKTPQQINFSSSDMDHLINIIEKGLPENHFLIFTTASADKRKKVYKAIADKGLIIDCSVATGSRKADIDEQRTVLQKVAKQVLSSSRKTIETQAFQRLIELTGFNLDLFSQNLEKLIVFSGNRSSICLSDVNSVIIRDKKDPIYTLTNAVLGKDVTNGLICLNSLLKEGYHPLQILKSFENQIRKLILVKCFTTGFCRDNKQVNLKQMNFNAFKQAVLPKIIDHDAQTKTALEELETPVSEKKTKKSKSTSNDLFLAPYPKNAYPVFQVFQKSENFSLNELNLALIFLSDLDLKLKSSSFDVRTALENFIINICSRGGFVYAEKNKNRRYHF